jgi:hypothetical protein
MILLDRRDDMVTTGTTTVVVMAVAPLVCRMPGINRSYAWSIPLSE